MDYKKIDIFAPWIFLVLVLIYLLFSFIGFNYHLKNLVGVSSDTIIIVFLGMLSYIIGMYVSKRLLKTENVSICDDKINKIASEKIVLSVVVLGILLQIINLIYLGGIPLFSGQLKAHAVTRIWLASYLLFLPSINILIAKYDNKLYYILFIIGLLLFVSTGYRTTAMAIVLSVFITIYYTKNLKLNQIILAIVVMFILLVVVGYVAVKSIEWQVWTLNPIELLFYRAGYTLQVLDNAVHLQSSTHGQLLYNTLTGFFKSTDPRVIVGSTTLGYAHSTTSTIFGPMMLDFGLWAMLLQMFIIGMLMNIFYLVQKEFHNIYIALYSILMAHVIIWIETGPTDLVIFLFFVISIIILIYTLSTKKEVKG
ncbi:MAG: hypothetical protein BZ136_03615 [Methanosphaera sp. rholeuAM74]|nr:MAG: hypothetical protein BZ136_03615 [Methanosphaera sp. rholeuAM74]